LRKQVRDQQKLVVTRSKKLETSKRLGPPLTQLVDQKDDIFEVHIGVNNITRVFYREARR
jgi:hypothetical protein